MRKNYFFGVLIMLLVGCNTDSTKPVNVETELTPSARPEYVLVIHGGAGSIRKETMSKEKEKAVRSVMEEALKTGEGMLKSGRLALDVVEETIQILENSPYFNSGKGAVFTHAGTNELDASIMDGKSMKAGAVGGVMKVKNPIRGARAVMEQSDHVLLTGSGADDFCESKGLEMVDPSYFFTQPNWDYLQKVIENEKSRLEKTETEKHGTVGAVALDKNGNIAAGTSTGGMTNKRYNRIGDSPIIGAGTYANNKTCGVSCTGHGEYFIRYAVAHDMSALIEYKGLNAQQAGDLVIHEKLTQVDGAGGLIAIDKDGIIAMPFNTPGMYRGYAKPDEMKVLMFKDEK